MSKTEVFRGVMPLPPGINHSYRIVRSGQARRLAASASLAQFKQDAGLLLAQSGLPDARLLAAIRREHSPLSVELAFFVACLLRRDIDGPVKAAIDAAFSYLGLNDNLVTELHCCKKVRAGEPGCEIVVWIAEPP